MGSAVLPELKFVRSKDGWVAGICQGLATRFGVDVWILRAIWIVSICWFGVGLALYVAMAFCLPREDRLSTAYDDKILGVCSFLAKKYGLEIGLVRLFTVLLALASFGLAVFLYLIIALVMSKES